MVSYPYLEVQMHMRRKDREVSDFAGLKAIIEECKVCCVAMQDEAGLYIVPMNFGYEFDGETLSLYFHSAKAGRKVDVLSKGAEVAFEMDCGHALVADDIACRNGFAFKSIVGNGQAGLLTDDDEKMQALKLIMLHQTGRDWEMPPAAANAVALFKITSTRFSGKQRLAL